MPPIILLTSALIYAGVDPVSVSRRLGHAQASTTTNVYAHVFKNADERNAEILESLFYTPIKLKEPVLVSS